MVLPLQMECAWLFFINFFEHYSSFFEPLNGILSDD
jgi:hypothetical protein